MFELLGVTLLQPEAVIAARLPGGAEALAGFVQDVKASLENVYAMESESGARTLTLALGAAGRLGFWISAGDDAVPAHEEERLAELNQVTVPHVVDGPIALALVFRVGPEALADVQLTLPDAWQAVVRASDTALTPEQIIARIWASA